MPAQSVAWNKGNAAAYAERYANSPNTASWPYFSGADCTNFISQSLRAGGVGMDTTRVDRSKWYMAKNVHGVWGWGYPWTVAKDFYTFFRTSSRTAPHRYYVGTYDFIAASSYPIPPNSNTSLTQGDFVSYDFDVSAGDGVDHTSIVTASGTDAIDGNYSGDLVCYHSRNTKRIIWHLKHRLDTVGKQETRMFAWGLNSTLN